MLFLGSKKYPKEDEYKQYIETHAGQCNAYTSYMDTNYMFEVSNDGIEGALDRFAQFFISPLFTEDCVQREMKAIDSENTRYMNIDE